jgi:hypothetical protein
LTTAVFAINIRGVAFGWSPSLGFDYQPSQTAKRG